MTVPISIHVQAAIDLLNGAQLQDSRSPGPITFGRGERPEGAGWQGAPAQSPFQSYGIVWRIGSRDSRNKDIDDDQGTEGRVLLFVRYYGGFPDQADDARDLGHAAIMVQALEVPGRHVVSVRHDNGQTSTRSEDVEYTLWEAGDFYRLWTRPA